VLASIVHGLKIEGNGFSMLPARGKKTEPAIQ